MQVFFTPARDGVLPKVIDGVRLDPQGRQVGTYSGETLEQLAARYPGIAIGLAEDITAQREAGMRTDPAPCDREAFMLALEILPPEGWTQRGNGESFKMVERLSGRMTRIYVRTGSRYWTFVDVDTLSHAEIMVRVHAVLNQERAELAA